jgi:hypothetical protein
VIEESKVALRLSLVSWSVSTARADVIFWISLFKEAPIILGLTLFSKSFNLLLILTLVFSISIDFNCFLKSSWADRFLKIAVDNT